MPTDTQSYLRDIDSHTDRIPNASPGDKIFLIRLTSNREVNNFIERQPKAIKHDYNELCKAILAEYSDYGASGTLTAAMAVKQTHNELADCYYNRLRQAYFGNQNYEGMEEDKNFKALYIQNLHPNLSHLLGVYACPLTQDIRQLKTLVARAQSKHLLKPQVKPQNQPTVYSVDKHMELEGAPTTQKQKWGTDRRPQSNNQRRTDPKNRQWHDQKFTPFDDNRAAQPDGKDRAPQLTPQDRPATTINKNKLSREEQSLLRSLLRKAREKRTDTADVFAVSSEDTYFDPHVLRDLQDEVSEEPRDPHAQNENAHYDQRDVMVIQVNSITDSRRDCPSTINCKPPFHQFIGDLQQKGTYGKLYLPVTLEDQWEHEALVDTAADISMIGDDLFGKLQSLARKSHRDLKTQPCDVEIRPYSQVNTTIRKMALMQLTVGPMTLVHPVYSSPFNAHPLLLGQDLLNQLKPPIDFQRLKIWAQVREPLPIPRPLSENHCYFIGAPPADCLQPAATQTETGQETATICAITRANAAKLDPTPDAAPTRTTPDFGKSDLASLRCRQMTLPLHRLYQPAEANIATAYTTHQYRTDPQDHLEQTFAFTQKKLGDSAEGRKAYYDQKASRNELQVENQHCTGPDYFIALKNSVVCKPPSKIQKRLNTQQALDMILSEVNPCDSDGEEINLQLASNPESSELSSDLGHPDIIGIMSRNRFQNIML
uniref:Uncharacterized protein n=1 Tax=Knipowitschia caucasica TaxID=637954 RepID=A0AAV2L556_KNICA